jgi:hypothetical protein
MATSYNTPSTQERAARIEALDRSAATRELAQLARALLDELETARDALLDEQVAVQVALHKQLGRCEYAFQLIAHSDSLQAIHEVALQLHSELLQERAP